MDVRKLVGKQKKKGYDVFSDKVQQRFTSVPSFFQ